MADQIQAPPRLPEQFMHKNRLQEYAQRSAIPLPVYQTINEGSQHAPKFRSTVLIDGATYRTIQTFNNRKSAEQDVARLALEGITKKIKDEGCPLVRDDTVFCKSILNEFAVKMNLQRPSYTTSQPEGLLPVFVSTLVFNGKSYTGNPGRTKREAEQLAARAVILSILGNSDSRTILSQIIKSKSKLYAALHAPGVSHDQHATYGGFENSIMNPSSTGIAMGLILAGNMPHQSYLPSSVALPPGQPGIMPTFGTMPQQPVMPSSLLPSGQPGVLTTFGNTPQQSLVPCMAALPYGQPGVMQSTVSSPQLTSPTTLPSGQPGAVPTNGTMPLHAIAYSVVVPSGQQPSDALVTEQSEPPVKKLKEEQVSELELSPAVGTFSVGSQPTSPKTRNGSRRGRRNKKKNKPKPVQQP